ncbi:MAG: YciI family protein [Pseudomonadota bacterium]
MKFTVYAKHASDKQKILAHRPAHREYMRKLLNEGNLLLAGPFADDSGGLFV